MTRRSVAIAAALVATSLLPAALGADGSASLRSYFLAKDDAGRAKALEGLAGVPVPKDAPARIRALREALSLPPRKGFSKIDEKLALPKEKNALVASFCTPKGYDERKTWPVVLSLHGHKGTAHHGVLPFAFPPEEADDVRKKAEEQGLVSPGQGRVPHIPLSVPWEDGIVVAPGWDTLDKDWVTAEDATEGSLAALARLGRGYAGDPDKVVLAGMSMGGFDAWGVACARPDRFAGVVILSASLDKQERQLVSNLKPLEVYIVQGEQDDKVPVTAGRADDASLKEAGVAHVYEEVAGLTHGAWPKDGAKLKTWMRARTRTPWPREIKHRFLAREAPRRVFWVELPAGGEAVVEAKAKDNTIDLDVSGASSLTLRLGEPLVDLEKEVVVRWKDAEVFRGKVERSWAELLQDLSGDGFDVPRAAPAKLEVKAP